MVAFALIFFASLTDKVTEKRRGLRILETQGL